GVFTTGKVDKTPPLLVTVRRSGCTGHGVWVTTHPSGFLASGWFLRCKVVRYLPGNKLSRLGRTAASGVMITQHDVLLIHGTWGHGGEWDDLGAELIARGFTVDAPSLPHHGRPGEIDIWDAAQRVTRLGLLDYVDFLVD